MPNLVQSCWFCSEILIVLNVLLQRREVILKMVCWTLNNLKIQLCLLHQPRVRVRLWHSCINICRTNYPHIFNPVIFICFLLYCFSNKIQNEQTHTSFPASAQGITMQRFETGTYPLTRGLCKDWQPVSLPIWFKAQYSRIMNVSSV